MTGRPRVRVTQYDLELTIDRCKHEACRDESAEAQHRQHEWSRPMVGTPIAQTMNSPSYHSRTMPEDGPAGKWRDCPF
jgi:hypothetical protein